jgi:hypothetical protein
LNRVLARPRVHCGDLFTPSRKHQQHCKPSCRLAAFRARQELKQRAVLPELLDDALCRVPFE